MGWGAPATPADPPVLTLRRPDDWHVHLRDGAMLRQVAPFTARQFARAIIMPNLVPPVSDIAAALAEWLAGQPHRRELRVGAKTLLLVHSTPWEPRGTYVYPQSALLDRFAEAEADFVLYGHTHHQVVRRVGRVLVINPGSAGDARDPRNGGRLSCAVLDTVSEDVTLIDFADPR